MPFNTNIAPMMYRLLPAAFLLVAMTLVACNEPTHPTISLYRAVRTGDLDQVKRNLYWGANVNQADIDGDFPLHVAARAGRVNIARELVTHGADPLALDAARDTPLEVALANGKTQVARMLVDHEAPLDAQGMFVKLVRAGVSDRDTFDFLIGRGARANLADARGEFPLHIAITAGHLATMSRLLAHGADVNQADGQGRLPLDLALQLDKATDRGTIVRLLKTNGAKGEADDTRPEDSASLKTGEK